jgi:diguanylate cyclase (GGDEF)-like protein
MNRSGSPSVPAPKETGPALGSAQQGELAESHHRMLVSYRIRTVRIAVYATYMAVATILLAPLLPGHRVPATEALWVLAMVAVAGASLFGFALNWPLLFEAGWGERVLYAWSALDILLVTVLCAITGGPTSVGSGFYVLTTIFFAASYPARGQICLFLLSATSYLTLALSWPTPAPADLVFGVVAVAAMAWFMAAFLARERDQEMVKHLEALSLAEHRAELLGVVARTASDITTFDSELAMAGVTDSLVGLGFDLAAFDVLEEDGAYSRRRHGRGLLEGTSSEPLASGLGLVGLVREANATVVLEDYRDHPMAEGSLRALGLRLALGAPVQVGGRLRAVLIGGLTRSTRLSRPDIEVFELLAVQIGRSLENAGRFEEEHAAVAQAMEASRRDELTGVGNRRHANALLGSVRPNDAVVLLDLDHFKAINDRHGHAQGDLTLVQLAAHLRSQLRDADDIARFGGEEFLIVLRAVGGAALGAASRLIESWRRTGPAATFSAGVAAHTGDVPAEMTLKRADAALYAAKTLGRDRACAYGPELDLSQSLFSE